MKFIKTDNGKALMVRNTVCGDLIEFDGELFVVVNVSEAPDLVLLVNLHAKHTITFSGNTIVTPMDATISYKPLDVYEFYKQYGEPDNRETEVCDLAELCGNADSEKDNEEAEAYDPLSL